MVRRIAYNNYLSSGGEILTMNDIKNILIIVMTSIISLLLYITKNLMDTNHLLARDNVELTEEIFKMRQQTK